MKVESKIEIQFSATDVPVGRSPPELLDSLVAKASDAMSELGDQIADPFVCGELTEDGWEIRFQFVIEGQFDPANGFELLDRSQALADRIVAAMGFAPRAVSSARELVPV